MDPRPDYGIYGKIGPAPGFTWGEARCSDGSLPKDLAFRKRVVAQANLLNTMRGGIAKRYGVPMRNVSIAVNSWYRSPSFNRQIGGARYSQHLTGSASDIRVYVKLKTGKRVMLRPAFVGILAAQHVPGFKNGGIGSYDARYGNFTHLDGRGYPARWVNIG